MGKQTQGEKEKHLWPGASGKEVTLERELLLSLDASMKAEPQSRAGAED